MNPEIRELAELFRETARTHTKVELSYDATGVRWLDGYIDRNRAVLKENPKFQEGAGCFFGECIRETFGGKWVQHPDYGWGVKNDRGSYVFPFNKVMKHVSNEDGDSILGLFDVMNGLPAIEQVERSKKSKSIEQAKKPWWKFF